MTTQETKTSGDSAIRILLTLAMDVQKIRDINKEAFLLNDSESNTLSSEDTFKAARAGLHLGGVDLDTIMESLPKEQMKEDLHDALIVSMAFKDPCVLGMAMLFLKGMVIPLANELKDAKQTIQTLTKVMENN